MALHRIVPDRNVDQVIIALDRTDTADPLKLFRELRDSTAAIRIAPDLLGLPTVQMGIEDLDGLINAVVTVTDGDGDVDTDSIDIGDRIKFADDGPSADIIDCAGMVTID